MQSLSRTEHSARSAILALALLCAAGSGLAWAEEEPFESWHLSFNVGSSDFPGNADPLERDLTAMTTADFDGDGDLDVAFATANSVVPGTDDGITGFALIFNDGSGNLVDPVHVDVSAQNCFDIVSGDFDEDGDPDIAVSIADIDWSGQSVRVYLNDGSGAFPSFQTRIVTDGPVGLAAADFDRDGHLDLAVASYNGVQPTGFVSILRGDGAGGLSAPAAYPVMNRPFKLAGGDLNGDGAPDLAVAHEWQAVSILLNQGDGTFGTPEVHNQLFPMQGGMYYPCVELGDSDRDGDLDVFYANTRSHQPGMTPTIVHLRNDGGTFVRLPDIPLLPNAAGPTDLAAGDLNGDGWTDLVGLNYSGREGDGPRIVLSNGAGGFLPASAFAAGQATFAVDLGDLDDDGDLDLLTADCYSMAVTVHQNPGNGIFPVPQRFTVGFVNIDSDAGDVDGDGDLDLFTSTEIVGGAGALLRNLGDGTFAPAVFYSHSTAYGRGPANAKLRDLDGDGDLDLLYNDSHTDPPYDFHTAMNDGNGNFGPIVEWTLGTAGNGDIDAFDIDGDGDLDVVNCEELGGGPGTARRLFIRLNNGDGTFAPTYIIQIGMGPHALIGGDYNEDGLIDLVTTHYMPYGLRDFINVHIGNGDGTFQEEVVYQTGQGPRYIVQSDLNGDGHIDLATANTGQDGHGRETLTVLFGAGDGTFGSRTDYYAPFSPDLMAASGLAAGDIDRDGDNDLMMTTAANGVALYYNDGNGAFTFDRRLGLYWGPRSPIHAEFSGDGIADLAVVTSDTQNGIVTAIAIMRGTGAGPSDAPELPLETGISALSPASPNPFRSFAQFQLEVPTTQPVEISVHDLSGRTVQSVYEGELTAGARHAFVLDGATLPAGVYFVRALGKTFESSQKIVLAR